MRANISFSHVNGLLRVAANRKNIIVSKCVQFSRTMETVPSDPNALTSSQALLQIFRKCIPKWDPESHKGQSGRIAVIGGSKEYTGAPFFAAMASMRAGADLVTVFCDESAAIPIKSYSPDLMVTPELHKLKKDCTPLSRMHTLVIGPGLGRREEVAEVVHACVQFALDRSICVVLDADSLWFLAQSEDLRCCVRDSEDSNFLYATPNVVEMQRIRDAMNCKTDEEVVEWFGGRLVFLQKGTVDLISAGDIKAQVDVTGAKKRVGGQGDILAGIIGQFAFWTKSFWSMHSENDEGKEREEEVEKEGEQLSKNECKAAAAVAASVVTRRAAEIGFDRKGRSLVTSDILGEIGDAFDEARFGSM